MKPHYQSDKAEKTTSATDLPIPVFDAPFKKLLYSVSETAGFLGCDPSTVYRLIYRKRLKVCAAFGRFRISYAEIDRLISDTHVYDGPQPEKQP